MAEKKAEMPTSSEYTAKDIKVLKNLEPVRERPSMYIGDVSRGHQQITEEIFDNAGDEFDAGYCDTVTVNWEPSLSRLTIADNGRGIPTDKMQDTGKSALTTILTTLHAGGKLGQNKEYATVKGTHGVGVSVAVALSAVFEAWVIRNDVKDGKRKIWYQEFRKSHETTPEPLILKPNDPGIIPLVADIWNKENGTGTIIRFTPDTGIIPDNLNVKYLKGWLEESSYLCPGLAIIWQEDGKETDCWVNPTGLTGFVDSKIQNNALKALLDAQPFSYQDDTLQVYMSWTSGENEDVNSYVNRSFCSDGGYQETGFKKAVTRALAQYAPHSNYKSDDLRLGLTGAFHLRMKNAQYHGQIKSKMTNPQAEALVYSALLEPLSSYFQRNGELAQFLADRAIRLQAARQQDKATQEVLKSLPVTSKESVFIPPKKSEVVYGISPDEREIYLTEGLSASGTVKAARFPWQEVLPLQGKFNNCIQSSMAQALKNPKIQSILQMVGGISFLEDGNITIDLNKVRSKRVIFMFDQDEDGCLRNNSLIPMLSGETKPISELIGESFWIWSCTPEGKLVPGFAHDVRITRHVDKLLRITLDNGKMIECTHNHPFLTREGEYLRADQLSIGMSLMPFNKRIGLRGFLCKDRPVVYDPYTGKWEGEHILSYKRHTGNDIPKFYHIHHRDKNRFNNSPDNLLMLSASEHSSLHNAENRESQSQKIRELHRQGVYAESSRQNFIKFNKSEAHRKELSARNKENWQNPAYRELMITRLKERGLKNRDLFSQLCKEQWSDPEIRFRRRMTPCVNIIKQCLAEYGEVTKELYDSKRPSSGVRTWENFLKNAGISDDKESIIAYIENYNHQIVNIEEFEVDDEPVYDMTVDNWHNFALDAGVFVHNSHIESLGFALWCRYLLPHIQAGYLYRCNAPLFRGSDAKGNIFFGDTLEDVKRKAGTDKLTIVRMKGWGSASARDVRQFACDPNTRSLTRITLDDDSIQKLEAIMGSDSSTRKEMLGLLS